MNRVSITSPSFFMTILSTSPTGPEGMSINVLHAVAVAEQMELSIQTLIAKCKKSFRSVQNL